MAPDHPFLLNQTLYNYEKKTILLLVIFNTKIRGRIVKFRQTSLMKVNLALIPRI